MYYPGGCTESMGPTAVLEPSSPYRSVDFELRPQVHVTMGAQLGMRERPLAPLSVGAVAITHFDAWHRGTAPDPSLESSSGVEVLDFVWYS